MQPLVAVLLTTQADGDTLGHTVETLAEFNVPCTTRVLSPPQTPAAVSAAVAEAEQQGVEIYIVAAGDGASLASMIASATRKPVLAVPLDTTQPALEALRATVQQPVGIALGTLAVGKAGAINAALFAVAILANKYPAYRAALHKFREEQTKTVLAVGDPRGG